MILAAKKHSLSLSNKNVIVAGTYTVRLHPNEEYNIFVVDSLTMADNCVVAVPHLERIGETA